MLVADWRPDDGRRVTEEIRSCDGTANFLKTDTHRPDVQAMVRECTDLYGRIDILFNNAGIEGEQAPTADCAIDNWDRVIAANQKGVFPNEVRNP